MGEFVDYIVDLCIQAGKVLLNKQKNTCKMTNEIREYVERQRVVNEVSSLAEEIDFQGLKNYLSDSFLEDVRIVLYGRRWERDLAKKTILTKAYNHAQADNRTAKEKVRELILGVLNIIQDLYWREESDENKRRIIETAEEVNEFTGQTMAKISEELGDAWRAKQRKISEQMEDVGNKLDTILTMQEMGKRDVFAEKESTIEDVFLTEKEAYYRFTHRKDEVCTVDNMFLPGIYTFFSIDSEMSGEYLDEENACCSDKESLFKKVLEILHEQRILLIVGDYGSGKTILLKVLHKVISRMENVVVFSSLCHHMFPFLQSKGKEQLFGFCDSLYEKNKKHYIFLDSLDDLNLPYEESKSYLEQCMDWITEYLRDRDDFYLIVTSRNFIELNHDRKETIQQYMAYYYFNNFCGGPLRFIKTREMNGAEIGEWIEQYGYLQGKSLDKATVKRDNGRIMKSLSNPLFLFIFMGHYIKKGIGNEEGYYCYYQEFVRQTIEGKYYLERSNGACVLQKSDFVQQYQDLLEHIAFDILENNNNYIELEDEIWNEEVLLGERLLNRNYYLREHQFSRVTGEKVNTMSRKGIQEANLLNCYFIAKEGDYIFFRDVNILFLLAANRIYKSVYEVIRNRDGVFNPDDLKDIRMINFYPQLLDFVLYKITADNRVEEFRNYAYNAICEENLRSKLILLQRENSDIISKILLLYIIFIKLNCQSFLNVSLRHIIKDMAYYNILYKEVRYRSNTSAKYVYSVERYFMGINLMGAKINRLNLKYYNFQGAHIFDSTFQQCRFYQNNFENIEPRRLSFELCSIGKMQLSAIRGDKKSSISMKNCQIQDCNLESVDRIRLQGCWLQNITISVRAHMVIEVEECIVQSLHMKCHDGSSSAVVKFINCIFKNTISLKKMKGKIVIVGQCIKIVEGNLFKEFGNVKMEGMEGIF